ncbi:DUF2284 domain-containing protein [Raineyella sp. LH-20]|uniref:DUF2284 domain-containing protein n=1 Tax=Raineyella sp. LH-20 TaxID=3081204 RepID=UPI002954C087|nr:DUF2284 domain-containing protein [Raineyella sp. LH-20]WOP19346.1 DUF2284 domain-containing protein [Raineyella sp. LH-20]
MLHYVVSETYRQVAVEEYLRDFVDVPRFHAFCRECPAYGRNWSCPPFDFDPVGVWARFRWLHLVAFRMEFTADQPRTDLDHDRLVSDVMAMFRREKRRAHRSMMALHRALPGSIPLGAGECGLCPTCTRRDGSPCRIPDQLVHSLESMGGDVDATMRVLFDQPTLWSDGTSLPDHYLLVVGLLCNQDELPATSPRKPAEGVAGVPVLVTAAGDERHPRPGGLGLVGRSSADRAG